MRAAVRKNLMAERVPLEKQDDFPVRLNNLERQRVEKNEREANGSAGVVKRIVRFRKGISVRAEGGLGGVELILPPGSHRWRVLRERVRPVALHDGNGARMVVEPDAGQIVRVEGNRRLRLSCRLVGLSSRRR